MSHGDASNGETTSLYKRWAGAIQRCENSNNKNFPAYGGRGITVCREWRSDYANFKRWALSAGYSPELEIDRIDNDKGYSPENCRWVSKKQQARNRRNSKLITYKGKMQTRAAWAEELGLSPITLRKRLITLDWPVEKALTTPTR